MSTCESEWTQVKTAISNLFYLLWYNVIWLSNHIKKKICNWLKGKGGGQKNKKVWHGEEGRSKNAILRMTYFLDDPIRNLFTSLFLLKKDFVKAENVKIIKGNSYYYKRRSLFLYKDSLRLTKEVLNAREGPEYASGG